MTPNFSAFVIDWTGCLDASAEGGMTDFLMLVGATVGSMTFGVLSAYGIFRAGFALMRPRPKAAVAVKPAPEVAV